MKRILTVVVLGWLLAGCATEKQMEGFDYRCFDRCHENRRTDRDCVQQCTDEQSVKGQSQ